MQETIRRLFEESAAVKRRFVQAHAPRIEEAARRMAEALCRGQKLFFAGNGGSAADAQHLAAEFVNQFIRLRRALPAIALTTDSSALTAIGNDRGFDQLFVRQLEALGRPGDVLVAISTSGNSPNVLRAVETARQLGLLTIAFTGGSGGRLASLAEIAFVVPSSETPRIQETHITLGHALCGLVDDILFPDPGGRANRMEGGA